MRRTQGFTILELMIVVAIVAILSSIAWPSYQQYVRRGKRADAQALMMAISSREQQHLLAAREYTDVVGPGGLNMTAQGYTCTVDTNKTCESTAYKITVTVDAGPPAGFTVVGTPQGTTQPLDGTLSLTSAGAKTRMLDGSDKGW